VLHVGGVWQRDAASHTVLRAAAGSTVQSTCHISMGIKKY
jgi:hypothetical protein